MPCGVKNSQGIDIDDRKRKKDRLMGVGQSHDKLTKNGPHAHLEY